MHDDDMPTEEFAPPQAKGYEEPIDLNAAAEELFDTDFVKGFDLYVEQEFSDPKNKPSYWTSLPVALGELPYGEAETLLKAFAHASTADCTNCQAYVFRFMTDVFKTIVDEMVRRDGLMGDGF